MIYLLDLYTAGAWVTFWIVVFVWLFDPWDRKRSHAPPITLRRCLLTAAVWPLAWPYAAVKAFQERKYVS